MKLNVTLIAVVLSVWRAESFVANPRATTSKLSKRTVLFASTDWAGDSADFINKIPEIPTGSKKEKPKPKEPEPAAPPPPPVPAANAPIGISAETISTPPAPAPQAPPAPKAVAPAPPAASSSSSSVDVPNLPIPALAGGALVAFAAATFAMRGGVDEREAAQSVGAGSSGASTQSGGGGSSAASTSDSTDLLIPYHAAAQLAYEKSDKSMPYAEFQTKYEADAVADVKAKQKK